MCPNGFGQMVSRKIVLTMAMLLTAIGALSLAGCGGIMNNPFATKRPLVVSPYPADLTIVIDRNTDTYFSRQHVHQVISAKDMMSLTTYTNFADYHNHIASVDHVDTPLTRDQLQAMWNEITKHRLLYHAFTWHYWNSPVDNYQRNAMTLQIRANGLTQVYHQFNHWDNNKLGLVLLCESVDLPIGQNVKPEMPQPATKLAPSPLRKSKAVTTTNPAEPSDNTVLTMPKAPAKTTAK
ncbi:MAG: hypothetical protein ACP5I8_03990 [Phycisphaerae bacterium]